MLAESRLKAYKQLADQRLQALLPGEDSVPQQLHEAMRYSALAEGKRIRPALCMAASISVGGSPEDVLDAACAVEMIHCFSLIHDDLPAIDDDALRRGRPTCHMQFSESMAILAGDALFALAFQTVADAGYDSDRTARVLGTLARASGSTGLVGGEVLDVLSEGANLDEQGIRGIHQRKTGALIAACCEIGGILGGGNEPEIAALHAYGESVGLAFQIIDDVLNETASESEMGKAVGSDRERGKSTYVAVLGLAGARSAATLSTTAAIDVLGPLHGDTEALVELAEFAILRHS